MMQLWEKDMVRFMRDASEYGSYNQELVKRLSPYLNKEMNICDAGCGLGYLSLALAPYVGTVTGVERHPDAAAVLVELALMALALSIPAAKAATVTHG